MKLLDVGGLICKNFSIFLWSNTFHKTTPETSTYYLTLYPNSFNYCLCGRGWVTFQIICFRHIFTTPTRLGLLGLLVIEKKKLWISCDRVETFLVRKSEINSSSNMFTYYYTEFKLIFLERCG